MSPPEPTPVPRGEHRPVGPRSAAVLAALLRAPRWVLVFGVIVFLLGGVFAPGLPGAALILVVTALVGWLAWLGWSATAPGGRLVRLAAVAVLLAVAASKL